jgi:hypothetical protein
MCLSFAASAQENQDAKDETQNTGKKKGWFGFLKKKDKDSTDVGNSNEKSGIWDKLKFWKKKDEEKSDEPKGQEKKTEGKMVVNGHDLEVDESPNVKKIVEKYKLSPEEMQVKSMAKSGEPLNAKGKKLLKKVHKKEAKMIKEIHKFNYKHNRNIQSKEVKKRMKNNNKKSKKRIDKTYGF